jgi:hypothetical protein
MDLLKATNPRLGSIDVRWVKELNGKLRGDLKIPNGESIP